MRDEYDFIESVPHPSAKKPVTMRLEADVVDYFKTFTEATEIPYPTLINKDCERSQRKLSLQWGN